MAVGLGLEQNYFSQRFTNDPTLLFRIFNYPSASRDQSQDWGVQEHTDMGFLTILKQDHLGGLEVKTRDDQWIEAPPMDGAFIINIGDMLELWTWGLLRATPHRVRNAAKSDRISMPFFYDPNWQSTLEPISKELLGVSKTESQASERWDKLDLASLSTDMTYGDFVWSKVKNVFPDLA